MNKFEYKHIRLDYKGRGITQEINILDIDGERIRSWGSGKEVPTLLEMFEALGHLKNWKPHRETGVIDFDREEFLEEFVDGMNYFLSVLVLLGHDSDDLFRVYQKKDKIIHDRIKKGY